MSFICIKLSKECFTPIKIKPEVSHGQHLLRNSAQHVSLLPTHKPRSHLKPSALAVLSAWECFPSDLSMATWLSFRPQVRPLITLSKVTLPLTPIPSLDSAAHSLVSEMISLIHFAFSPLKLSPRRQRPGLSWLQLCSQSLQQCLAHNRTKSGKSKAGVQSPGHDKHPRRLTITMARVANLVITGDGRCGVLSSKNPLSKSS